MACNVLAGAVPEAGVALLKRFEQAAPAPFESAQPFNMLANVFTRACGAVLLFKYETVLVA
jgi:hypothetical protein